MQVPRSRQRDFVRRAVLIIVLAACGLAALFAFSGLISTDTPSGDNSDSPAGSVPSDEHDERRHHENDDEHARHRFEEGDHKHSDKDHRDVRPH